MVIAEFTKFVIKRDLVRAVLVAAIASVVVVLVVVLIVVVGVLVATVLVVVDTVEVALIAVVTRKTHCRSRRNLSSRKRSSCSLGLPEYNSHCVSKRIRCRINHNSHVPHRHDKINCHSNGNSSSRRLSSRSSNNRGDSKCNSIPYDRGRSRNRIS